MTFKYEISSKENILNKLIQALKNTDTHTHTHTHNQDKLNESTERKYRTLAKSKSQTKNQRNKNEERSDRWWVNNNRKSKFIILNCAYACVECMVSIRNL